MRIKAFLFIALLFSYAASAEITVCKHVVFNTGGLPDGLNVEVGQPSYASEALVLDGATWLSGASGIVAADNFGVELKGAARSLDRFNFAVTLTDGSLANRGVGLLAQQNQWQGIVQGKGAFGNAPVKLGEDVHLAFVRDRGTNYLFVSGKLIAKSSHQPPAGSLSTLNIGSNPFDKLNGLHKGTIKEVRTFTFKPGKFAGNDLLQSALYVSTAQAKKKTLPFTSVGFKKIVLFEKYITEGASIGDINNDGKPDVVAGPLWWQGPELQQSFSYAPVKVYPLVGPGLSAYSSNFFTFPDSINGDRWMDILKVGIPGQPSHWAMNPGEKPLSPDNISGSCQHHLAQEHVCHESPQLLDIIGDSKKELLSFSGGRITLGIPSAETGKGWERLPVSHHDPRRFPAFLHGLGAGDVNGDTRTDILEKNGWWEQPADWDQKTPWTHHPAPFGPKQGGAQMFCYDVDGDGDNDVVTAMNAHSYGLAWFEQVVEGDERSFKQHDVMTDKPEGNPYGVCFSQPHAMECVDIDGDGIKDVITGKCFFAHNGRDPGSKDPAVLYWFRTTRHPDGSAELVPHLIDNDSGVGRQISAGDLNADGKMDLVVGNKKGVFAFIQTTVIRPPPEKKFREGMGNTLDAQPKTMEEQRALFKLPKGFVIENVSHEALGTIKPISLTFDDAGRLWTQTAMEYPVDNNLARFEQKGRDKILVFPQPHLPGPQTPRVFAEGLVMPSSVLPVEDGVHVIQGPRILKLQDTNQDGVADKKTTLMKGFGVKDSHTSIHRLTRGPGNWIYASQGVHSTGTVTMANGQKVVLNQGLIIRYQPDGTRLQVIGEGMNNIWAWAINREGRTYIHEANDLGYSQAAFERDATYPSFLHTMSRGTLNHPPTSADLGLDGTGFSGIATAGTAARDFPPPWRNFNFVANPITGEINTISNVVDEFGNPHFVREMDLVSCGDPMFRPVNVSFGPDGCLYIIDWYNQVISHGTAKSKPEKHDRTHGRIWRVRHTSQQAFEPPDIEKATDQQLVTHLTSGNLWEMRSALNQIGKRQPKQILPSIVEIVTSSSTSDSVRIHALWALEHLGHFDGALWENLLASKNQNVRFEALRALSTLQPEMDSLDALFDSLREEKSYYVLNELVRFFRDTPQKLDKKQLQFIQQFFTSEEHLPNEKVKGWKGEYHALGGSYEKRFLNQLITRIGKAPSQTGAPDEAKWSQFLEQHPMKSAEVLDKLNQRIAHLDETIRSSPKGDIEKGAVHFSGRCAVCHDANLGGFAPPLAGGAHRDIKELLTAMLNPDEAVEGLFYAYKIVKKDGSTIEGFRSGLSHKAITLTFMGGAKVDIPFSAIKEAGYVNGRSVMFSAAVDGMTDQDITDLIAYLRTLE